MPPSGSTGTSVSFPHNGLILKLMHIYPILLLDQGYGAVVYGCITDPDGQLQSSLIMLKARVAPIKKVTLPSLKILGSLVGA